MKLLENSLIAFVAEIPVSRRSYRTEKLRTFEQYALCVTVLWLIIYNQKKETHRWNNLRTFEAEILKKLRTFSLGGNKNSPVKAISVVCTGYIFCPQLYRRIQPAYDTLTTTLRHELRHVNQLHNLPTTIASNWKK